MKAGRVPELNPTMPLACAARRIVAARADELYAFVPAALAAENPVALHDMRIAAKRLRYALDLVGFCLDASAGETAKRARALQTLLGDIHDCDVLLARVEPRSVSDDGMRFLAERFRARRSELFAAFEELWAAIEAGELRERLAIATALSPQDAEIGR
jgi:CHAD domain-containing protein